MDQSAITTMHFYQVKLIEQIINPNTLHSNYRTMSQNLPYQIIQHNLHHILDYSNIHYQVLPSAMPPCSDTLFCICNGNTLVGMINDFSQVQSSILNNFSKFINKIHSSSSCPTRSPTFHGDFVDACECRDGLYGLYAM